MELFFFDADEQELVARAFVVLDEARRVPLLGALDWLARLAGLVIDCPTLTVHDERQGSASIAALVDHLGTVSDHDLALHLPTKAVLGQGYLVAKINFLRALEVATEAADPASPLLPRLRFEIGQSIYSRLAEELFLAIAMDRGAAPAVRHGAGELLHRIWDSRLLTEIDDVAPMLEAAWEARNKVRPVLGTLLGTHELFRLFQEARNERFLDYFVGEVSADETEAFEEFLFGLAHEDLVRLRAHLSERRQATVTPDEAARILGLATLPSGGPSAGRPEALYTSYKARQECARFRAQTGLPGPRRTAEEYVMRAFLQGPVGRRPV